MCVAFANVVKSVLFPTFQNQNDNAAIVIIIQPIQLEIILNLHDTPQIIKFQTFSRLIYFDTLPMFSFIAFNRGEKSK